MIEGGAALRIVRQTEIEAAFELDPALDMIRRIYRMAGSGSADVSTPAAMSLRGAGATHARFKVKGAVLDDLNVAGFRLICDAAAETSGSGGRAYCYLADPRDGAPLALVEEEWLHAVRTALTGIVAIAALAPKDATQLVLIGTGRIARHFAGFVTVACPYLTVTVASRSPERAAEAAQLWSRQTGAQLEAAVSISEAIRAASVVVTLSDAQETLFTAQDVAPGTLICAMGGRREFDREILDRADRFIVDEMDFVCTAGNVAAWIEAGTTTRAELAVMLDDTLGDVLNRGEDAPTSDSEVTLAVIQGMAACDIGLAKWILDRIGSASGDRT